MFISDYSTIKAKINKETVMKINELENAYMLNNCEVKGHLQALKHICSEMKDHIKVLKKVKLKNNIHFKNYLGWSFYFISFYNMDNRQSQSYVQNFRI
jgi:hypothetical protein